MDKIIEVKQKLAIYANENDIPVPAVNLMEKLIENNVSYADADKFCEEHFINRSVADLYKGFYEYIQQTKEHTTDPRQLIEDIKQKLALLEDLL